MNHARADALAARHQLLSQGWISARDESFRHLPPPALAVWLPDEAADEPRRCDAPALAGSGWTLHPIGDANRGRVDARWLDATDTAQRAELFAGLEWPKHGSAASFALAHRATCRQGLRLRIGGTPSPEAGSSEAVWLHLRHQPRHTVESPTLVIELLPGEHGVLLESHERDNPAPDQCGCARAVTQNLRIHIRLGAGATLRHVRLISPGADDCLAHGVVAQLDADARYDQVSLLGGSRYHLQRTEIDLQAPRAEARTATAMLIHNLALEHQVRVTHTATHTHSSVEAQALASGSAHGVLHAHTRMAPACDEAIARQRLNATPTGGQPKLVLRPHMEIHHDNIQATHGATWGALPEDALFYARQRGLSEVEARALILKGWLAAMFERCVDNPDLLSQLAVDAALNRAVERHLSGARLLGTTDTPDIPQRLEVPHA
ncbi:MAG TPA: SufD family Fe-S cluster assembly protein [Aquabacterium sp.]|nr:SufD family Fe-S cluster assembly protein [Aquabacterium sp.]